MLILLCWLFIYILLYIYKLFHLSIVAKYMKIVIYVFTCKI